MARVKVEKGNFGKSRTGNTIKKKITITSRPRGKRKIKYKTRRGGRTSSRTFDSREEAEASLRNEILRENILPKKGQKSRRIVQDGAIFKVSSDGSFERVGFTRAERERRERIRKGTATARDIFANVDQTTKEGQRRILNRIQPVLRQQRQALAERRAEATRKGREMLSRQQSLTIKPQDIKEVSSRLNVSFNPRLSVSANLSKYKSKLKKPNTKLSQSQVNFLSKWADKINKRGKQLTQQEQTFISFLKNNIQNQRQKTDKILDKLPKPIANLGKLSTKASQRLNNYFANLGVGVAYTPSRIAQALEKSLFIGGVAGSSAVKKDYGNFWANIVKENKRVSPYIQSALRDAFKDPATYVFPLVPALRSASNSGLPKPSIIVNKPPKSKSLSAKQLKGKAVMDTKGNLYKIDNKANVIKASTKPLIVSKNIGKSRKNRPITKAEKSKISRGLARDTNLKVVDGKLIKKVGRARKDRQTVEAFGLGEGKGKLVLDNVKKKSFGTTNAKEIQRTTLNYLRGELKGVKKERFLDFFKQPAKQTKGRVAIKNIVDFKKTNGRAYLLQQIRVGQNKFYVSVSQQGRKSLLKQSQLTKTQIKNFSKQKLKSVKELPKSLRKLSKTEISSQQKLLSLSQKNKRAKNVSNAIKRGDKRLARFEATKQRLRKQYDARQRKVQEVKASKAIFDIKAQVNQFMRDISKQRNIILGKPKKQSTKTRVLSEQQKILRKARSEAKKSVERLELRKSLKKQRSTTTSRYKKQTLNKQKIKSLESLAKKTKTNIKLATLNGLALSNMNAIKYNQKNDVLVQQSYDYVNEIIERVKPRRIIRQGKPTLKKRTPVKQITKKPITNKNPIKKGRPIIRKTGKKANKPLQKPPLPKIKLPKLKFDSKKLENRILTFKGTFRERRNPNRKAGKSNPVVTKTITLRDTKNRALKRVAKRVDNSLSASLTLKVVGVGKAKKDIKKPALLRKFRTKKNTSSPALRLVERNKFRFDKKGEKRESKRLRRKKRA